MALAETTRHDPEGHSGPHGTGNEQSFGRDASGDLLGTVETGFALRSGDADDPRGTNGEAAVFRHDLTFEREARRLEDYLLTRP